LGSGHSIGEAKHHVFVPMKRLAEFRFRHSPLILVTAKERKDSVG
jgi:hypothetical protein